MPNVEREMIQENTLRIKEEIIAFLGKEVLL